MNEVEMLKENQILFTYLHLSAAPQLTKGLIDSKSICIAYETVTDQNNKLYLTTMNLLDVLTIWHVLIC